MCGINCIIAKAGKPVDPKQLADMNRLIFHRGPDDEGFFQSDWVGLGFRRLSIIDTSYAGHQPMHDSSGRYVCVFNGEIYNYIELREQLKQAGYIFKTQSDTEVVINAYTHWGEACLNHFVGMFAIIIVDLHQREMFIVRDQLGIKPLYYMEDEHYYYFSSEIKAFNAVTKLQANPEAYFEQFIFRYVSGDRTNFSGVKKLLPGHYMKYNDKIRRHNLHCYFDLKKSFSKNKNVTTQEISEALQESFLLHTRSDVGYSLQLSGGVDSSYITSVLSQQAARPLMTFSISLNDPLLDESQYQLYVSQRYKTDHHMVEYNAEDYFKHLNKATYHMDAPIMHGGCVFLMLLCQEISKQTKVVLTGEGADELFGGYRRHLPNLPIRLALMMKKFHLPSQIIPALWKLRGLKHLMSDDLIYNANEYNHSEVYRNLFSTPTRDIFYRKIISNSPDFDYSQAMQFYDQSTYLCSLLDRQDKISMAMSVETRVPYVNPILFKSINALSSKIKIQRNRTKFLLKQSAASHFTPDFLNRKKNGLLLPYDQWLKQKTGLSEYLSLLTDTTAKNRGIYQIANIKKNIDQFRQGDSSFAKPLLCLIHMEVWHRVFNL